MGRANMLPTEGRVLQGMGMSKVAPWGKPELGGIPISSSGIEYSKAMGGIGPRAHKRVKGERFRGNTGKNV